MQAEMLTTGQRPGSSGFVTQRGSKDGHQVTMDGHARYQQAVYDGNVYIGANTLATPVTTQVGLSATTPAWTLWNPAASGKLLVLWRMTLSINAAPAAATTICLAANNVQGQAAPSSVTLAIVTNAFIGNANQPVGQCYAICTLAAAPTQTLHYFGYVDAASSVVSGNYIMEFGGDVVVGQGMSISVMTKTATAIYAAGTWEEINV